MTDSLPCTIHRFQDPDTLARAACACFAQTVEKAIKERGRCSIAISGGSTPRKLFRLLASPEWAAWPAWQNVTVFWVDERAVPGFHPDSNYRLAEEGLFAHVPIPPNAIHSMRGDAEDLEKEAERYEMLLREWADEDPLRLDLALLGMGADAHTASLFPHSPALMEKQRWVVPAPGPPPQNRRLTMTYPLLNNTRTALFLVAGEDKAKALRMVWEEGREIAEAPARGIELVAGSLLWFVDESAASLLRSTPFST